MQPKWYSQLLMLMTIQEETVLEQLKTKSASAYDYLEKIPMEQWCNMQRITT